MTQDPHKAVRAALLVAKHFARGGYATQGGVDDNTDLGQSAQAHTDLGGDIITQKLSMPTQALRGMDLEANVPQFATGAQQLTPPQAGGAPIQGGNPLIAARVQDIWNEKNGNIDAVRSHIQQAIDYHKSEGNSGLVNFWDEALRSIRPSSETEKKFNTAQNVEGNKSFIPYGDPAREENLAKFQEGNHPEIPSVTYHGTGSDFSNYEITNKGAGSRESPIGHWFTDNPESASDFANFAARGKGANVQPVHLSIKNPLIADNYNSIKDLVDAYTTFSRPDYKIVGRQARMVDDKVNYNALRDHLIKSGYDGIVLPSTFMDSPDGLTPIKQIVAFHPHQIKSATGNQGTFDPSTSDITKEHGGLVTDALRVARAAGGGVQDESSWLSSLAGLFDKENIQKFAESLPSPEENIDYLKNKASDVGSQLYSGAQDIGSKAVSGLSNMAEQASQESPKVRDQLLHLYEQYMNPQAPEPESTPLAKGPNLDPYHIAGNGTDYNPPAGRTHAMPDGTFGSKEDSERAWNLAREVADKQWMESGHPQPDIVDKALEVAQTKAPSRLAMRAKLAAQEAKPVAISPDVQLPPKTPWDFPQVYKDIMSTEPKMAWTKGMTPKEQPQVAAPQPALGSINLDGNAQQPVSPLDVNVTKKIPSDRSYFGNEGTGPDQYIGKNYVHSTPTMIPAAPTVEGQKVAIPATPPDLMPKSHVPDYYYDIQGPNEGGTYKAKEGLQSYNPPEGKFPNKADVDFYRSVDATYGAPEAGYLQAGARGNIYEKPEDIAQRQGGIRRPLTPNESDALYAAYMAAQKNPISALGYQPDKFDLLSSQSTYNVLGQTFPPADKMYVDPKYPSVMVHEPFHYELKEILNDQLNKAHQEMESAIASGDNKAFQEADKKRQSISDIFKSSSDEAGATDDQEKFVRSMMLKQFGPIENYELKRQGINPNDISEQQSGGSDFINKNADKVAQAKESARQILMKRRAMLGPHAAGGRAQDRPHFGFGGEGEGPEAGSTGSASGNSYGGGGDQGNSSESNYGGNEESSNDQPSFGSHDGGDRFNSVSARAGDTPGFNTGTWGGTGGQIGEPTSQFGGGGGYGEPLPQGSETKGPLNIGGSQGLNYVSNLLSQVPNAQSMQQVANLSQGQGLFPAIGRAFTGVQAPNQGDPYSDISMAGMNKSLANINAGIPSDFATPAQMMRDYGSTNATPLAHPGQTSDAYLNAGPSASIGRQDFGTSAPSAVGAGSPVEAYNNLSSSNFSAAFAAAHSAGQPTFTWTNPNTGVTSTYTTQLKASGGSVVDHALNVLSGYGSPLHDAIHVARQQLPGRRS